MDQTSPNELTNLLDEILAFFQLTQQNCLNYRSVTRCCELASPCIYRDSDVHCTKTCFCYIVGTLKTARHSGSEMLRLFAAGCFPPKRKTRAVYGLCHYAEVNGGINANFLAFAKRLNVYDADLVFETIKKYELLDKLNE